MSPPEYKKILKELFQGLSSSEAEAEKLRKIDVFRRTEGVKKYLRHL